LSTRPIPLYRDPTAIVRFAKTAKIGVVHAPSRQSRQDSLIWSMVFPTEPAPAPRRSRPCPRRRAKMGDSEITGTRSAEQSLVETGAPTRGRLAPCRRSGGARAVFLFTSFYRVDPPNTVSCKSNATPTSCVRRTDRRKGRGKAALERVNPGANQNNPPGTPTRVRKPNYARSDAPPSRVCLRLHAPRSSAGGGEEVIRGGTETDGGGRLAVVGAFGSACTLR